MREVIELHSSGSEPRTLEVAVQAGADFGHLFDVKSGRASQSRGRVVGSERGIDIECSESDHRTTIDVRPAASGSATRGGRGGFELDAHGQGAARITVKTIVDEPSGAEWAADAGATHSVDHLSHDRYSTWQERVARVVSPDPRLTLGVRKSLEDLASLRIFDAAHPELAVVAAGAPWYMTLFGRDSLLTSFMALPFAPELARDVLHELAELQGRTIDPASGEEPGKILHELRSHGGTRTVQGTVPLLRHRRRDAAVRAGRRRGDAVGGGVDG